MTRNTATAKHKIAIITGGSRGLGRSTVLSLAQRGVDSIFTYNSNRSGAEKVVGLVAEAGRRAIALQLDTGNVGAFRPLRGERAAGARGTGEQSVSTTSSTTPAPRTTRRSTRPPRRSWTSSTTSTSRACSS